MKRRELTPVRSYEEVPPNMSEDEARAFWSTHEITDEYLASAPSAAEPDSPPALADRQSNWVAVHLPKPVFQRLRAAARERGVSVVELIDTLLGSERSTDDTRMRASRH